MPAASSEIQFCSEWVGFDRNTKAELIVMQSQQFLTQVNPKHWNQVSPCFRREAPRWVYRIDNACSAKNPANLDAGMTMGALIASILVQCSAELPAAGPGAERAPD